MTELEDSILKDAEALAHRVATEGGVSVSKVVIVLMTALDRRLNVVDRRRNNQWLAEIAHYIITRLVQFL